MADCTLTVDKLIIGNPGPRQIVAHDHVVFGGDAQPKPVARPKLRGDGVKIIEAVAIDPGARHGQDQVGMAKTHRRNHLNGAGMGRNFLMHQIKPGNAKMNAPGRKFTRNFARRKQLQIQPVKPVYLAGIFAAGTAARQRHAAFGKPVKTLFLQAPLGGHGQADAHHLPPFAAKSASGRRIPPMAGMP